MAKPSERQRLRAALRQALEGLEDPFASDRDLDAYAEQARRLAGLCVELECWEAADPLSADGYCHDHAWVLCGHPEYPRCARHYPVRAEEGA